MDDERAMVAVGKAEDTAAPTENASGDGGTGQDDEQADIADSGENEAISANGTADVAGEGGPAAFADVGSNRADSAGGPAAETEDGEPATIADGKEDGPVDASGLAAETEGTDGAATKTGLGEVASGSGEIVEVENQAAIADGTGDGVKSAGRLAGEMGEDDKTAKSAANSKEQLDSESTNTSDGGEKAASASTADGGKEAGRAGNSIPDRGDGDRATKEKGGQAVELPPIAIEPVSVMLDDEDGATVAKSRGKKRGELLAAFVAVALRQHV